MKLGINGLHPSSLRLPFSIKFCCVIYIAYHKTKQITHERYVKMLFEEWCAVIFTIGTSHYEFLNFYLDSLVKCADFYISSCKTNKAMTYTF